MGKAGQTGDRLALTGAVVGIEILVVRALQPDCALAATDWVVIPGVELVDSCAVAALGALAGAGVDVVVGKSTNAVRTD